MRLFTSAIVLIMVLFLSACGGGSNNNSTNNNSASTSSLELTAEEYNALPATDKYAVMNKLTAALYQGVAAKDFFDLTNGLEPLTIKSGATNMAAIKATLKQPLADKSDVLDRIDSKYYFGEREQPIQYPLAMLYEFPLSQDYFNVWMAYRLANTILFSPAYELDTCAYSDIQKVFYRLVSMMEDGSSIRDIVYEHMISQENWRRFRSPEDNTREMMEIFLARFEDAEVPRAALACQNWSLTDGSEDYQLIIGYNENTEPQSILDTTVTTCTDFYAAISNHADLIPRITSILVESFLFDASTAVQEQIVDTIVSENPSTFEDIFIPILFSRAFLVDTERPGQLEEIFFNIAHRISWWAKTNFFKDINHAYSTSTYPSLKNMKQAALTYKLGRPAEVPLDTMSFSYFHKAVREKLLLTHRENTLDDNDDGWPDEFIDVDLTIDEFIKYLFLSVISRLPTNTELTTLNQIIEDRNYTEKKKARNQAFIVMDYLSRLSETYYLNALN